MGYGHKSFCNVRFYAFLFASSCRSKRNYPVAETKRYFENSYNPVSVLRREIVVSNGIFFVKCVRGEGQQTRFRFA